MGKKIPVLSQLTVTKNGLKQREIPCWKKLSSERQLSINKKLHADDKASTKKEPVVTPTSELVS